MARRHHPDRNPGDPGAEGRFKAIHEAYTVLSDPARRRAHEAGRGRTVASETFLADFTDAVERAEWIVFGQLLPRQAGGPRERVARLARDFATSSVQARLLEPRPGLLARLRARREARRLRVHVDYRSHPPAVAGIWRLAGSGWAIVLYPEAFWARGVREPPDLDEVVLTVVLGRVVTILAAEQRVDLHGIDGERWGTLIERARDRDRTDTRTITGQVVFWGAIAALSAAMLYSAWASS